MESIGSGIMSDVFSGIPKEKRMDIEWLNNVWMPNLMKQRGLSNEDVKKRIKLILQNHLSGGDKND